MPPGLACPACLARPPAAPLPLCTAAARVRGGGAALWWRPCLAALWPAAARQLAAAAGGAAAAVPGGQPCALGHAAARPSQEQGSRVHAIQHRECWVLRAGRVHPELGWCWRRRAHACSAQQPCHARPPAACRRPWAPPPRQVFGGGERYLLTVVQVMQVGAAPCCHRATPPCASLRQTDLLRWPLPAPGCLRPACAAQLAACAQPPGVGAPGRSP